MKDLDQLVADAEHAWVEHGRLLDADRVVRQHVLGACARQLGPICTNGIDFFLETGMFSAGGRSALLLFPAAWSLLGSCEGAWLAARLVSMVPRDMVADAREVSDWACDLSASVVERESSEWWRLHE
ncbi:MAG: hypothetical protein KAI24_22185, partial [Planctomycetes bacterium]|nr:hypothetical protein [Planctomycetota bacterium]